MRKALSKISLLFFITALSPVNASPVMVEFEGEVTFVSSPPVVDDPAFFSIGDALRGSYVFDDSSRIVLERDDTYIYTNTGLEFSIGDRVGSSRLSYSTYANEDLRHEPPLYFCEPGFVLCESMPLPSSPRDVFRFNAYDEEDLLVSGLGVYYLTDLTIFLEDFSNTAIPSLSDGFLNDPPLLSNFDSNYFALSFCAGYCPDDQFIVLGTINSLDIVDVPEPGSLALFVMGLAGIRFTLRRNHLSVY